MQHQSGAPTQVTRALRRYRRHRMRLWGRRPGPTRWPVLTISTRSSSRWKLMTTQICFPRSTLWTVWRMTTSVMASQLKSQDPWRRLSTPDITQLLFLDSAQAGWKATRIFTHTHTVDSAPRKQQSTEGASTPNIGRGAETELKTPMHSHNYGQDTAIYCRTTSMGCLANQTTYCGASPQDVRHLFACTTHPTNLSPEDLWRNPVGSIQYSL